MTEPVVRLDVAGPVATITLNRPASRNAISGELLTRLGEAMATVEADDEVRAAILTGADPAFCAGVDLKEIGQGGSVLREAASGGTGPWAPVSKPVIAAVNGAAVTGGLELVLNCDIVICSDRAVFADTHARPGARRRACQQGGPARGPVSARPPDRHRHRGQRPAGRASLARLLPPDRGRGGGGRLRRGGTHGPGLEPVRPGSRGDGAPPRDGDRARPCAGDPAPALTTPRSRI
jgi:hypothetical protein